MVRASAAGPSRNARMGRGQATTGARVVVSGATGRAPNGDDWGLDRPARGSMLVPAPTWERESAHLWPGTSFQGTRALTRRGGRMQPYPGAASHRRLALAAALGSCVTVLGAPRAASGFTAFDAPFRSYAVGPTVTEVALGDLDH